MSTPTWVIIIGVCLLLFGGCNLTRSAQSIMMPQLLEFQQELFEDVSEAFDHPEVDSIDLDTTTHPKDISDAERMEHLVHNLTDAFSMTDYAKWWSVRLGLVGLFAAILYMLAGVFLLARKRFAIRTAYVALALSVIFSVVRWLILTADPESVPLLSMLAVSDVFSVVIDVILIVTIAMMDKAWFSDSIAGVGPSANQNEHLRHP